MSAGYRSNSSLQRALAALWAIAAAILVGAAGFGLGVVLIVVAGVVIVGGLGVELSSVEQVALTLLLLQGTAFPIVAVLYLQYRGLSFDFVPTEMPTLRDWGWIAAGTLLALGLAFGSIVVVSSLGLETAQRSDQELLSNPDVLLALIPLAFLLIGPGEELLFRGIIQGRLRETFGAPAAIVLANLGFAPAHIVSLTGSVSALLVSVSILFVPGCVFGFVYERTENFAVPAIVHGAYDAVLFGLGYVALKYGSEASAGLL